MGINLKNFATNEYVKSSDLFYWGLTQERIESEIKKSEARNKKITILAVTSMVISTTAFLFVLFEIIIWQYITKNKRKSK